MLAYYIPFTFVMDLKDTISKSHCIIYEKIL